MRTEPLASIYRRTKPASYEHTEDWANFILRLDGEADVMKTDLGVTILFSDGSRYLMEQKP